MEPPTIESTETHSIIAIRMMPDSIFVVGNLEPNFVPAVAQHTSNVPDRLWPLGLGIIAGIDGFAHKLHLALVLRYWQRGFPERPSPSSACKWRESGF